MNKEKFIDSLDGSIQCIVAIIIILWIIVVQKRMGSGCAEK